MNDRRLPLEPGLLDRRVAIQRATEIVDAAGFPTHTWVTLAVVPMGRELVSGAERVHAGMAQSAYDARWTMHYRADMDPDCVDVPATRQLVYQGRVLEIVDAQQIGRRDGIQLTTRASTKAPA